MIFFALGGAVLLVVIDQLTKLYVTNNFSIGELKELIAFGSHKIISITHIRNSGMAWSMMEGKTLMLVAGPILVIAALIAWLLIAKVRSKLAYISCSLIIAGGVGNLIDRIRLHEVVDFIKWEVFSFPVFNFADICVVCGAIIFCVYYIFIEPKEEKKKISAEMADASAEDEAQVADSGDEQSDE